MCFGGMLIALALMPVGIVMGCDHSFAPEALCWAVVSLAALSVAGIGTFRLRFEPAGTANQHPQATLR